MARAEDYYASCTGIEHIIQEQSSPQIYLRIVKTLSCKECKGVKGEYKK